MYVRLLICVFIFIAHSSVSAVARDCSKAERQSGDRALRLSEGRSQSALNAHLPWGMPIAASNSEAQIVLVQNDYVISYDANLRVPSWTAHTIGAKKLGKNGRINCFRSDPRLADSEDSATPADYEEPIYDQGHMTPNGDMTTSVNAVINSFVMTNMAPQHCRFNCGIWQMFETLVRIWGVQHKRFYIFKGAIFAFEGISLPEEIDDLPHMRSRNGSERVAIPSHFYKVLAYQDANNSLQTLSILLEHSNRRIAAKGAIKYLKSHTVTLEEVEAMSGLKLFPAWSGPIREAGPDKFWNTTKVNLKTLDSMCK